MTAGELVQDAHACAGGWLPGDDDRPAPCPRCKPHVAGRARPLQVPASPLDLALSESAWQSRVVDYARLCGWRHFHAYSSRRSPIGWPDLALLRGGRLVMAELKSEKGRLRPEQRQWLDALREVPGVECYVWRPSAWPQVQQVLR